MAAALSCVSCAGVESAQRSEAADVTSLPAATPRNLDERSRLDDEVDGGAILASLEASSESRYRADAEASNQTSFRQLTNDDFERETVVLYFIAGCSAVEFQSEIIQEVAEEHGIASLFRVVFSDSGLAERVEFEPRLFPTTVLLEHGEVADVMMGIRTGDGGDRRSIEHFLFRNGLIEDGPTFVRDYTSRAFRDEVTTRRIHDGDVLRGLDLRDAYYQLGSFSAADLRDADLRGADLRASNFSNADLRGAKLRGAQVDDAIWLGAICPDGKLADEIEDGCASYTRDQR